MKSDHAASGLECITQELAIAMPLVASSFHLPRVFLKKRSKPYLLRLDEAPMISNILELASKAASIATALDAATSVIISVERVSETMNVLYHLRTATSPRAC